MSPDSKRPEITDPDVRSKLIVRVVELSPDDWQVLRDLKLKSLQQEPIAFEDVNEAINYEKRLKGWNRKWKLQLIEKENPSWFDLYEEISE